MDGRLDSMAAERQKRITIRMPVSLWKRLGYAAVDTERSQQEIMLEAFREWDAKRVHRAVRNGR